MIVGFPRSGTTLAEKILDAHPAVCSAEETPFLSNARLALGDAPTSGLVATLAEVDPARLEALRAVYARSIDAAASRSDGDRVVIDKNPHCLYLAPLMLRMFRDVRLIVAVRDPRDVLVSCFTRDMGHPEFIAIDRIARAYAATMDAWFHLRSLGAVPAVELRYEELIGDVEGVTRRVLETLGVGWDDSVRSFQRRAAERFIASPTYAEVARPIDTRAVGRWKRYRAHIEPALPILAPYVEAFGYEAS